MENAGNGSARLFRVKNLHINPTATYYKSNIFILTGRNGELAFLEASIGDQTRELAVQRLKDGGKINAVRFDASTGDVYFQINGYGGITINQIAGDLMTPTSSVVTSIPSSATSVTIRNVTLT